MKGRNPTRRIIHSLPLHRVPQKPLTTDLVDKTVGKQANPPECKLRTLMLAVLIRWDEQQYRHMSQSRHLGNARKYS